MNEVKNLFKLKSVGEQEVLKEQKNLFRFYLILPLIIAIITFFAFFVWGIVDPCVFYQRKIHKSYPYEDYLVYGIMQLKSGFSCWFIWVFIGAVVSSITYFILKLVLSYKILHICYLDRIYTQLCGEEKEETVEEKPEIEEITTCKNCGNQIFKDEDKCSNCGEKVAK